MRIYAYMIGVCVVGLALFSIPVHAIETYTPVPAVIHYQAHMTTVDGLTFDGTTAVRVFIYDSPDLGAHGYVNDPHVLYAEDHGDVRIERGTLRLSIGEGAALGRFAGASLPLESLATAQALYAEVYLDGEYLAPRQRISFHNAAIRAQYARRALDVYGDLRLNANNLPDMDAGKANSDQLSPSRIPSLTSDWLWDESMSLLRLPNGIPLSKISGGSLSTAVLPDFSAGNVSEGKFQASQLPDTLLPKGAIAAAMGNLNDGDPLPAIANYTPHQCAWIVAYYNSDPDNLYIMDGINKYFIRADMGDSGVTCQFQKDSTVVPCPVEYLIFCKNDTATF